MKIPIFTIRIVCLWLFSFLPTSVGFHLIVPSQSRLIESGVVVVGRRHRRRRCESHHYDFTLSAVVTGQDYSVEVVEGGENDPRVLDVASFRNGLKNPEMMVERAKSKRESIDTTAAAVDGLKIGLLYVGPAIGLLTYLESNDVISALSNYAVLGGGIGALLAANNYLGRGVHVPDIPEATNRIIVDFSEGLYRQQDVGFVAVSMNDPTFTPTHGVMATVDVQLRNSDNSHPGARKVSGLPSHLHIKNMEVHKSVRRQGIGRALIEKIVEYAKTRTDAKVLTLEVEAANPAAVNLYKSSGFETRENPNKLSKNLFMIKQL